MPFKRYQHIERWGADETEGIEIGTTHVFPKIDGTNASMWLDGDEVCYGSRNRELSLDHDNHGFCEWASSQNCFKEFFNKFPNWYLYGEWLVPHSLKTYRENAWRKFYVFDVFETGLGYLSYEEYLPALGLFGIDHIPPICKITNGTYEQFIEKLHQNVFLIQDGKGVGEGIVIKNYDYHNKFGRQTWAKIVTSEFKEKHTREMGCPEHAGRKIIEGEIAEKYCTKAVVEKVHAKIVNECGGWSSKYIPRLLNTVYYDIITEECWHFVKEHKNPTIDFKRLHNFIVAEIKKMMPEVF